MPSREEMIQFLQGQDAPSAPASAAPSRSDMISFLNSQDTKPKPDKGILQTIGDTVDSVTGAPSRAAIYAAQNGSNPISAGWNQFMADPATAPTGEQIAAKAGLSTQGKPGMTAAQQQAFDEQNNPARAMSVKQAGIPYQDEQLKSPAAIAGMGIDMVADPTMLLPFAKTAKAGEMTADLLSRYSPDIAGGLKNMAEKFAVNATGATATQASKFAPGAGRELLDRGIVQFGDNQAKIAGRAAQAITGSEGQIDSALKELQARGVTVDSSAVKSQLEQRVSELKKDASQADIAKQLQNEVDNITEASKARGGADQGILDAEQTKRGYDRKAKNWADPEKGQAGKEAYIAQKNAVEGAATAADPALADKFTSAKKTYGLMAPIEEAAQRRAQVTGQSPMGGLLDSGAFMAGYHEAGGGWEGMLGGLSAVVGRRIVSPRLASTLAVSADKLGNTLKAVPELAKLADSEPAVFKAMTARLAVSGNDEAMGMIKAAQNPPQKGPAKWANDGANKLIDHAPDDKATIEKGAASADPKVKQLLIQASDLKPGSRAMDAVMAKLKNKLAEGDE